MSSAPPSGPAEGLARLRALAAAGDLDELCERLGIAVLTAFGSTVRGVDAPRDLDLAVLHRPGHRVEYLPLIDGLQRAAGVDVDLAVLDGADPVLRERALVGAEPLYESADGDWATAATSAALERMDTAWMRRLDRDLLAGRHRARAAGPSSGICRPAVSDEPRPAGA